MRGKPDFPGLFPLHPVQRDFQGNASPALGAETLHIVAWEGQQIREMTTPEGLEGPRGEKQHLQQRSAFSKAELPVLQLKHTGTPGKGSQNREA